MLNQMLDRPSGVGALSMIELHLLLNDLEELRRRAKIDATKDDY